MSAPDPYAKIKAELRWLQRHPEFEEKPATMLEFLGDHYLNIESRVRDSLKTELVEIAGPDVNPSQPMQYALAIFTGAIGIGKTTIASIVLAYLTHWVLCLKDPQGFFDLLPGSRIAFMQMSTSEDQAKEVVFGDVKARINFSPWFQSKYPYDPNWKNQLRFPKDIWILPGDSAETTFEGYNILGGILDEADSHKQTKEKDYAEQGYETIANRMSSRFQTRGFVMIIGQMKSAAGFASKKYKEFSERDDAYACRMTIWESFGEKFYRERNNGEYTTFWYDTKRKQIMPPVAALMNSDSMIEIPTMYRKEFENNPEKALKDLAGIPPAVGDPFISLVYKIEGCRDRWLERHPGYTSPVTLSGAIEDWFICQDAIKRVAHIDIAYSAEGDSMGIAMGHVHEVVEIEEEFKPYIVIDMIMRLHAPPGGEIFLGDMRRIIYLLRDERKFKIKRATLDGFQSQDTIQQFRKRRIESDILSVDRQLMPYHDLREAIYEERIEFPKLMVKYRVGDTEPTEVLVKELSELVDAGNKIEHPVNGSKDVADAVAGVTYNLMGERQFRRKVVPLTRDPSTRQTAAAVGMTHPAYKGGSGLSAPMPPVSPTWGRR